MDGPVEDIGSRSCVTRFVKTLLSIMEHGVKPHSKHLTEYFAFLYEFAKMGEEEVGGTGTPRSPVRELTCPPPPFPPQSQFLLSLQAISIMVHFYMGTKGPDNVSRRLGRVTRPCRETPAGAPTDRCVSALSPRWRCCRRRRGRRRTRRRTSCLWQRRSTGRRRWRR